MIVKELIAIILFMFALYLAAEQGADRAAWEQFEEDDMYDDPSHEEYRYFHSEQW